MVANQGAEIVTKETSCDVSFSGSLSLVPSPLSISSFAVALSVLLVRFQLLLADMLKHDQPVGITRVECSVTAFYLYYTFP